MATVHTLPIRIYYEDTDFSGVVYHANYLRFFERGRSEYLRTMGLDHRALFEGAAGTVPVGFVVRSMAVEFLAPARMDDIVMVETRMREVRGASAHLNQRIVRAGAVLVTADVRIAVVAGGRAVRFPPEIKHALVRGLDAD